MSTFCWYQTVNSKLRLWKCTNHCQEISKEAQFRHVQLTKCSSSHLQRRWLSRWGLRTHKRVLEEAAIEGPYFNSTCLSHGLKFNLLDGVPRDKIPLNQGTFCFFRFKDLGIKTKKKVWDCSTALCCYFITSYPHHLSRHPNITNTLTQPKETADLAVKSKRFML